MPLFKLTTKPSTIYVECAFGEIDLRFGMLWKKLAFDLHNSTRVIDACLRLHNFLVDYRETYAPKNLKRKVNREDKEVQRIFEEECTNFSQMYPDEIVGVFGDNVCEENPRKKLELLQESLKELGEIRRNEIATRLALKGFRRPEPLNKKYKADKPIYRETLTNQCVTI